ncbi:MAG: phospho-sugar mutase [Rikenellaceae bacterium]|nr:phospho-sugar mutase [Rikenellaceae bacterium]
MKSELDILVEKKVHDWLSVEYDKVTREKVQWMIDNDHMELVESFYKNLEFGTGGLRGIMGVGTNRMNIYTVAMATQGLANYLVSQFKGQEIKVAIAHDSRNNSALFARKTAEIFAANGFTVYLFDSLRPTPELSFTIRELGCKSGVVVTASHNPKEYNGYKAYWEDGAQVTSPHDKNIINEVNKITSLTQVKSTGGENNIIIIGEKIDNIYIEKLKTLMLSPEAVKEHGDMKIVYTPIHGTGYKLLPRFLQEVGFKNVSLVPEQEIPDGNFPTVFSPNPEEKSALQMAIDLAVKENAELVLATDPDADRVGIAIKNDKNEFILVNGNQTASLLTYYLLRRWNDLGKLTGKEFIVKTIVSSEILEKIADGFGVKYYNVLTGFKYIAEIIREQEGKTKFIGGGEESYGYLVGDFVRDKDAIISSAIIAEAAAWAKTQGMSLYDLLKEMYIQYGFYKESLISIVRKGKKGSEEIQKMMTDLRANPPKTILGSPVIEIRDCETQKIINVKNGTLRETGLPKSNVLQFLTEDNTIVSARPSGTEPKIKFYFGVREELCCKEKFHEVDSVLDQKIENIKKEMNLI